MNKLLFAAFVLLCHSMTAQNHFNGFTNFKKISESVSVIYFHAQTEDKFKADELNEIFLKTTGFSSSTYTPDRGIYRYKCIVYNTVTSDDVKIIMNELNLKMDPADLLSKDVNIKNEKLPVKSLEENLAPHYPIFKDTGNPEADNAAFDKAKQEWIKNYPDEVNRVRGIEENITKE